MLAWGTSSLPGHRRCGSSGCTRLHGHAAAAAPDIQQRCRQQHRRLTVSCRAAKKSYYEVLGVTNTASTKEIKSAYRKAALKLHPDVNSAPDAKDRFMEAKAAFETLTDDKRRAEYDRRLRMGFTDGFGASRSGAGRSSASSSSGGYGSYGGYAGYSSGRKAAQPEDDYSFDDLLRDLDKELKAWSSSRPPKTGGGAKSLWEELEAIGEELVDFLEETIGVSDDEAKGKASSSTSTSASASAAGGSSGSGNGGPGGASGSGAGANGSGAGSNGSGAAANGQRGGPAGSSSGGKGAATDYTNTDFYKKYEDAYSTFQKFEETLGGSAAGNGSRPQETPKKPPEQEIDDMLAQLKKKYKKT